MNKYIIKMLHDHILVRVIIDQHDSPIALPPELMEMKKASATTGIAEVVGPECKWVKKGDFVFYKQYVGNPLDHESLDKASAHIVVSEHDILGRI